LEEKGMDGVELRIRSQQLRAADLRRDQHTSAHRAVERIVHQFIQRRTQREIPRVYLVQRISAFAAARELTAAVADERRLDQDLSGQFVLNGEVILQRVRRIGVA